MEIQLIRNATMRINYAGKLFLTDPMLSPEGAIESFAGVRSNPTVELPMDVEAVCAGVDAVLASHLHLDHFDKAAIDVLPKSLPIYCQPGDEDRLGSEGFLNLFPVAENVNVNGLTIIRTGGQHGTGRVLEILGTVSGFILKAENEPTLYWTGDTIWCDEVAGVLDRFHPDVIVVHGCGAKLPGSDFIVMDDEMVVNVCRRAPDAQVVAVHMEALDHATVDRAQLRETGEKKGLSERQLLIPADGQTLVFNGDSGGRVAS